MKLRLSPCASRTPMEVSLAAHAHYAAAVAHGRGDDLSAHELSKQALEHSRNAHKLSEELATKAAKPGTA